MAFEIDVRRHRAHASTCRPSIIHTAGDQIVRRGQRPHGSRRTCQGARYVELPGADHRAVVAIPEPTASPRSARHRRASGEADEPDRSAQPRCCSRTSWAPPSGWHGRVTIDGVHVLEQHHAIVRAELERYRGREVDTAGDGFLAVFDGPARAIARRAPSSVPCGSSASSCARASTPARRSCCPMTGWGGIAVHHRRTRGWRWHARARCSSRCLGPVLVAGSGLSFEDRGIHVLKGAGRAEAAVRAGVLIASASRGAACATRSPIAYPTTTSHEGESREQHQPSTATAMSRVGPPRLRVRGAPRSSDAIGAGSR